MPAIAAVAIDENDDDNPLDMHSVNADIAAGAKAFNKLLTSAADDWTSWSITIRGFRALRNLVFARMQTSDIHTDVYRKQLSAFFEQSKYSAYSHLNKQARSAAYKLMDSIDEIDMWHATLPTEDKLRWKHPESIVKHAPKHLVAGGKGHNQPKPKSKKKPAVNAEIERLKGLLIKLVRRLAKYEPNAIELLDGIDPADPDDSVADL